MHSWHDVKASRVTPQKFLAMIEISKGSKNKYELDKETGHLLLDRVLFTSTHYPQNYGFIPRTFADDYDPLDVLVLCSESIIPMSLVECVPIGVLIMTDNGLNDEKIIAVATNDPFYNGYKDISEVPPHIMDEIKHFFAVYKTLEGKPTSVDVVKDHLEAERIIAQALENYHSNIEPKITAERKARGY
ncbi:MAG: inorganic diphosphatase [Bacilli bacterium]|nr:inorganic diphosphatase [Bacilli bacterium]